MRHFNYPLLRFSLCGALMLGGVFSAFAQKKTPVKHLPAKKTPVSAQGAKGAKGAVAKPMYLSFDPVRIKALQAKYRKELGNRIHGKHPRLFFNDADFAQMRKRVEKEPGLRSVLEYQKFLADKVFPEEVTAENYQKTPKNGVVWYGQDKLGPPAFRCALVYKLTGEKKYLEKSLRILRAAAKYYNDQYDKRISIGWYALSRLNALFAYDWLYNDMSEKDRTEIGKDLMRHFSQASDRSFVVKSGLFRPQALTTSSTEIWASDTSRVPLIALVMTLSMSSVLSMM